MTGTTFTDTTATPGSTWYYVCTAVNGEGLESGFSNEVSYTVPAEGAPVAENDVAETLEDTPVSIAVLANDSDPDGDPLSVIEASQPEFGSVAINDDNTVTYSPNSGFVGTDSFLYAISDGNGGYAEASVSVVVNESPPPPNDPPTALADVATTQEDTSVVIFVLANDTDPNGDGLSISQVTHGEHGWVSIVQEVSAVQYFPEDDFFGNDSFVYSVADGSG